jgi:hypothetical protein
MSRLLIALIVVLVGALGLSAYLRWSSGAPVSPGGQAGIALPADGSGGPGG